MDFSLLFDLFFLQILDNFTPLAPSRQLVIQSYSFGELLTTHKPLKHNKGQYAGTANITLPL